MYIGTPVCTSSALQWRSRAVETHCFGRRQEIKNVNGCPLDLKVVEKGYFKSQGSTEY